MVIQFTYFHSGWQTPFCEKCTELYTGPNEWKTFTLLFMNTWTNMRFNSDQAKHSGAQKTQLNKCS